MFSSNSHNWDGLIVLCAANNYDTVKMADQHVAVELAKLAPVLYVDPPVSCIVPLRDRAGARQLKGPRVRLLAPNLARLTPIVGPFPTKSRMTPTTALLLREYIRRAVAKLQARSVEAVISALPQYPVFRACREGVSIYWAQDDYVGGAALLGLDADHLARSEERIAAAADLVVAANPLVADTWRSKGRETLLIPFGAAVSEYANVESAELPRDIDLPDPVVGFIGHVNSRIDIRFLEAIANREHSLLLVGPKDPTFEPTRFEALAQRPNVRWVGYKEFNELSGYLRRMAVGIVPYRDSAFNRGSFPLKTLEYLAAGVPVVSTDLPASRWLATDLIGIASEPGPFADLVEVALRQADDKALVSRRREFSVGHSYAARAAEFMNAIQGKRSAD